MAEKCRYCGNGGCKRKVTAYLVTRTLGGEIIGGTAVRETVIPICGVAATGLQRSFEARGNVNAAGQALAIRPIAFARGR